MNPKISDMAPIDIQAALRESGVTQVEIARRLDVTEMAVSLVVAGKRTSHRIREAIAEAAGLDIKEIWPLTYIIYGGPRKAGRPKRDGLINSSDNQFSQREIYG